MASEADGRQSWALESLGGQEVRLTSLFPTRSLSPFLRRDITSAHPKRSWRYNLVGDSLLVREAPINIGNRCDTNVS